jgi:hypothetical protein
MNRDLLEKPFEPGQIRQRKGRNGMLDYVEGHSVIQRLNEALEGAWSFEIVQHEVREDEVLVLARLSAGGLVKMNFGVSQVTRERESGALVSLGDDLKAAATDALKKCATFLGVGLHLYADKPIAGRAPAARGVPAPPKAAPAPRPPARVPVNGTRPKPNGTPRSNGRPASSGQGNGHAQGSITPRQLDAVWKVGQAKGLDPNAVEHMSLRVFNRKPDALSHEEGAVLIKELSNLKRRVA